MGQVGLEVVGDSPTDYRYLPDLLDQPDPLDAPGVLRSPRAVASQPGARFFVRRTGRRHQLPERRRMIHAPQVHQLVDQHVVADRLRHLHQPPVQADVTAARARSPAPALIADADARDGQAVLRRQAPAGARGSSRFARSRRARSSTIAGCSRPATSRSLVVAVAFAFAPLALCFRPPLLLLDPRALARDKRFGFPLRSPARHGDAHGPVAATRIT